MRFLLFALFFFLAPLSAFAVNSPGPPGSDGGDSGPDIFGTVDSFGFVDDDGGGDTPIPWVWDFLVFGNFDTGSQFEAGTMGTSGSGLVYTGPGKVGSTGYGGGLGPEVWIRPDFGLRLLLNLGVYAGGLQTSSTSTGVNLGISTKPFFAFGVVTVGPVFKLWGTENYFVYAPVDLGYGLTVTSMGSPAVVGSPSSISSTTNGSLYADFGVGVNIRFLFLEAKVAWLPTPNAFGYGANDFFFPLTLGFDL